MTEPRFMPDGINSLAAGIARQFPDAALVAGYIDGDYAWPQEAWDLFPHAVQVKISVNASLKQGDVLDVEPWDATAGQAAAWIEARKAAGLYRPTIYCSRDTIPSVRAATGSYVLGTDYDIWVADYTGSAHEVIAPGPGAEVACAATQYESTSAWDASVVYDPGWPHRDAPPPPLLPAPASMSATPWMFLDLGWAEVKGAKGYAVQVRLGDDVITIPEGGTSARTRNLKPGAWEWRVQASGGEWTPWKAVG